MRRYVLLDRDGTIIVEKSYLSSVEGIEFLPGAVEGLRALEQAGWGLIVVSNQSGVARGKFTAATVEAIHAEISRRLVAEGVHVERFYFCPHGPADGCNCRKPATGMVRDAERDFGFDARQSWVIGDKPADVALGRNCGARTILVLTGYGGQATDVSPDSVASDLAAAACHILGGT